MGVRTDEVDASGGDLEDDAWAEAPELLEALAVLRDRQRREVSNLMRRFLIFGGAPLTAGIVAIEAFGRGMTPGLALAIAVLGGVSLALFSSSSRMHQLGLVGGAATFAVWGLFQFGPTIGTGLLFALSVIASTYFFEARGALLTVVGLSAALVVVAWASLKGLHSPRFAPGEARIWFRIGLATLATMVPLAMAYLHTHRSTLLSVEAALVARTRQMVAEQERKKALDRLLQTQRLETIGQLAGGVAHDFNNALAVLEGTLDELGEELSPEERQEVVDDGLAVLKGASATVKQLLQVARPTTQVGQCDPSDVIDGLVRRVQRVFPAGFSITADLEPAGCVAIPGPLLEQLLLNLLINARDATGGRGQVELSCRADGDGCRIDVADDGPGMSDEIAGRVFEAFYTTKTADRGTGLGLAMVKTVVEQAGGKINLTTAPGRGARFSLLLATLAPGGDEPPVS